MQKPVLHDNESTSTDIKWETKFSRYQNIFKSSEKERRKILRGHRINALRKDKEIAAIVGAEPEFICMCWCIFELYDYVDYLKTEETKKQEREQGTTNEKEVIKNLLLEQECGSTDYSLIEIKNKEIKAIMKESNVKSSGL